jgi:hypothetical protein
VATVTSRHHIDGVADDKCVLCHPRARYHASQEDDTVAKGKNTRKETKKPKKDKK